MKKNIITQKLHSRFTAWKRQSVRCGWSRIGSNILSPPIRDNQGKGKKNTRVVPGWRGIYIYLKPNHNLTRVHDLDKHRKSKNLAGIFRSSPVSSIRSRRCTRWCCFQADHCGASMAEPPLLRWRRLTIVAVHWRAIHFVAARPFGQQWTC